MSYRHFSKVWPRMNATNRLHIHRYSSNLHIVNLNSSYGKPFFASADGYNIVLIVLLTISLKTRPNKVVPNRGRTQNHRISPTLCKRYGKDEKQSTVDSHLPQTEFNLSNKPRLFIALYWPGISISAVRAMAACGFLASCLTL